MTSSGQCRVLLLSRYDRQGASSRLRTFQYLPLLRENGIEVTVAPLLDDRYLRRRYSHERRELLAIAGAYLSRAWRLIDPRQRYDLLWIEKELMPWAPALLERVLSAGTPYVVDYDDAIFHQYDLHPNRVARLVWGDKIDHVMEHARVVTAGNEYLANRARSAGARRVEIVRTVVDAARYIPEPLEHEGVVIGWIGSPATAAYLNLVAEPLRRAQQRHGARVVAIGSGDIDVPGVRVETRAWHEDTEVDELRRFDIGIMPLPDEPWERGKCGYKLVQYMAVGKAIVGSPVGVNKDIIRNGENGLVATTGEDWNRAFDRLISSPEERRRMGEFGRTMVDRTYSTRVTGPQLVRILREAARRGDG